MRIWERYLARATRSMGRCRWNGVASSISEASGVRGGSLGDLAAVRPSTCLTDPRRARRVCGDFQNTTQVGAALLLWRAPVRALHRAALAEAASFETAACAALIFDSRTPSPTQSHREESDEYQKQNGGSKAAGTSPRRVRLVVSDVRLIEREVLRVLRVVVHQQPHSTTHICHMGDIVGDFRQRITR